MEINKIYNEDCLDVMARIPNKSVDLVVTDPPYLISYKTNHRDDKSHLFCKTILNDNNMQFIVDYTCEIYRILKDDTALYMFCSSKTIDFFKNTIEKCGFKIKNIIVWVKNNHTAGDLKGQFGQQYEFIILANKGRCEFNGKRITDVWHFPRVSGKKQLHSNQKPVELIEQCIVKHSSENDIVFDGVIGSGTTAIACINQKRNYIGCELDYNYFKIATERIAKTKKAPNRAGTPLRGQAKNHINIIL